MTNEELGRRINKHPIWEGRTCSEDEATGIAARDAMRAELPPICGMSVEEIAQNIDLSTGLDKTARYQAANAVYRLAQPAPKVDPDAAAIDAAWDCAQPFRTCPPTRTVMWQGFDEHVREFWRQKVRAEA